MASKSTPTITPARQLALDALNIAHGYADAKVKEVGRNLGDQVVFWQKLAGGQAGDSWCMDFYFGCHVKAWCWEKKLLTGATGDENRVIMLKQVGAFVKATGIPRTGSCREFWDSQKVLGRQREVSFNPMPGDAVLFDRGAGIHHIGRCVLVLSNGHIRTIEGNTSSGEAGSQNDGDGVYIREHSRANIVGFVHFS